MAQIEGAGSRQRFLADYAPHVPPRVEFFARYTEVPRASSGFTEATVTAWRVRSNNVRITAVRKLAVEADDNGLLAPELCGGSRANKRRTITRRPRVRNWLSLRRAQALLNAPDVRTKNHRRICAVLRAGNSRRFKFDSGIRLVKRRSTMWEQVRIWATRRTMRLN
jgi:hypothetical protein